MARSKVSLVIPLYNKRESVRRTLDCVFAQTVLPDDIVIIDDGSTDGSADVVEAYLRDKPNTRVIRSENKGVSAARNLGISLATFDHVLLLDADDCWLPKHCETMAEMISQYPDAGLYVSGNAKSFGYDHAFQKLGGFTVLHCDDFLRYYTARPGRIHSSAVALKKTAAQTYGGFAVGEVRSEDVFLWLSLGTNFITCVHTGTTSIQMMDDRGIGSRANRLPCTANKFDALYDIVPERLHGQLQKFLLRNLFASWLVSHSQGCDISRPLAESIRKKHPKWAFVLNKLGSPMLRPIARIASKSILFIRQLSKNAPRKLAQS